jgi:hypothetical protein
MVCGVEYVTSSGVVMSGNVSVEQNIANHHKIEFTSA